MNKLCILHLLAGIEVFTYWEVNHVSLNSNLVRRGTDSRSASCSGRAPDQFGGHHTGIQRTKLAPPLFQSGQRHRQTEGRITP